MHESLMTRDEIDELHHHVLRFWGRNKSHVVSLADAGHHFENLGYELTRPIEHTLQAHGVVEQPQGNYIWPYPQKYKAWKLGNGKLIPHK